ncbi:hypothetical protein BHE74_00049195 [Ensete ventricosum]|nr:hypothetical protein BHE74_00049195 [Ensete ventricosum]
MEQTEPKLAEHAVNPDETCEYSTSTREKAIKLWTIIVLHRHSQPHLFHLHDSAPARDQVTEAYPSLLSPKWWQHLSDPWRCRWSPEDSRSKLWIPGRAVHACTYKNIPRSTRRANPSHESPGSTCSSGAAVVV